MEQELSRSLTKNEITTLDKIKHKWKELSIEDIILDGLYSNCIRLVREYLEKYVKIDLKPKKITEIGLKTVIQLLLDKDLVGAEFLLNQMNFDINQKLYQICFFTPYNKLRDYLIAILVERNQLNDKELEMIDYLRKLELAYPSQSFSNVQELITKFSIDSYEEKNEHFISKDLVNIKETSGSNRYAQLILEWIKNWSIDDREKILAESILIDPSKITKIQVNPKIVWSVLIEQDNLKLICDWIDGKESILFTTTVNQEMIDSIADNQYMPDYSKNYLLNHLAKINKFSSTEIQNFDSHLNRINSSQILLNKEIFARHEDQFHADFINLFNSNPNLPANLLWTYLDLYNEIKNKPIEDLMMNSQKSNSLKMMLSFRQNSRNFLDLSLRNLEYCLDSAKTLNLSDIISTENKEFNLTALALSLYQDAPVPDANTDHLLDEYPSLRYLTNSKITLEPPTVYELLRNHSEIDVGKFFQWQKSNTFCDELTISQPNNQILSFENAEFAKKYSFKDSLDYSYFLKQHRPFYAYYFLMQTMYEKYEKSKKAIIEEARLRTQLILIQDFQNYQTVSSCVHFTELIDSDSYKLKLVVHLMSTLFDYYVKQGMEEEMAREKCKNIFTDFFMEEIEPKEILNLFENIIINHITETFDQKTMFTMKACSSWLPLMCFSRAYNLPYTMKYLQLCAESNKWLMYLIYSQLYQIPKYQVISGLEYFTDIGLKQHLEYALHTNVSSKHSSILQSTSTKVKDVIKKTENKISSLIGSSNWFKKKKSKKIIEQNKRKTDSSDDNDSEEFEENPHHEEKNETIEFVDFYELILDCEKSPNPILRLQIEALKWKTPVLAVFATFYKDHDIISLLCTFLHASMKLPFNLPQSKLEPKNKPSLFDLNDLKDAIHIAASRSYLRTLSNSLRIFIPRTILDIYMEFLYCVFRKKDSNMALKLYSMYKTELIKTSLNKHQLIIPIEWYEEVINKLTRIIVLKCQTIDDLNTLTKLLGPDNEYRRFIKLIYTLKSNSITVSCDNWLDMYDKSEQFNEICFKCIEELLKIEKFDEADELANFCELSKDRIHLARFANQIEVLRLNNDFEEILDFWKHAHIELMKIGIKDSDFIDFLKFQNSRSSLVLERIVLLNLICQLVPNDNESSKNLRHLLFQFVLEHKKKNEIDKIHDIFKKMLLFGKHNQDPIKELVDYVIKEGKVNDFSDTNSALNEQDKDALNILLYNLVDIGKLAQAYLIAKYFKYYNQDFRILLNMIYICLEMINPEELDYSNQPIDTTSFKTTKLTNVLRSLSRPNEPLEASNAKMQFLDKLVYLCNYGNKFSKRIKLDFLLSNEILKMPYLKLLNENKWVILKNLLYSQNQSKFSVAKEFVKIYDLNKSVLADFVLNEFLLNLKTANDPNSILMLDPFDGKQFSKFVKIFDQEINLFGNKLLEKTRYLLSRPKSTEDFTLLTELIIRSHDCFTQSCSMEGISSVLQACKICAGKMLKAEEFDLMIRLLIEIGHYSEMTYIMDYLWNNQHFDMLIGKGKDNKLRLALLNYLKRHHPNDHNTYTMITLHFTMHREIAKMLEDAAYEQLKLLEDKTLENTSEILTDLQSITAYFTDAAKSFMKEDCVKQAEICIKKARLVALQIKILSTGIQIVNLNQTSVTKFLTEHAKFWEAYIVAEAYDRMTDLSLALFNQFVMNNNVKYFQDFKTYLTINQNTVEEIVNRYKLWISEGNSSEQQAIENIKILLKCCKDISFFYRMSSSLDLTEWALNEASSQKYLSILNDMILNKKL